MVSSCTGTLLTYALYQQAMLQLLSLCNRYQNGKENVFQRGFAGIRDAFTHIKTLENEVHKIESLKRMQLNIGEKILT